jgi:hypothetical protein
VPIALIKLLPAKLTPNKAEDGLILFAFLAENRYKEPILGSGAEKIGTYDCAFLS